VTRKQIILAKVVVWLLCLAPLVRLIYRGLTANLTANPVEFVQLSTGTWALVFLLASLAISPLRKVSGWSVLIRFRRLLGLFAFFYAFLHLLIYLVLDLQFNINGILADVIKRPFITAGFTAFVLLAPLAATSTAWSIRRLGGKNWTRLHRLVYISAIAGVVHFWWKVKADIREPAIYAAVLAVLLGARVVIWVTNRQAAPSRLPAEP